MTNTSDIASSAGILEKAFARDPGEDTPRPSSRPRGRYVSLCENKLGDTGAIDLVAYLKQNQVAMALARDKPCSQST